MRHFYKLILLAIFAFFGCENFNFGTQEPLSFEEKNYEKKIGLCAEKSEQCMTLQMSWQEAKGGVDSVRNKLNLFIHQTNLSLLTMGEYEFETDMELDSAVIELGEEYMDYLDDSEFAGSWFFESKNTITYIDTMYVSLETVQSSFTGGAHPNSGVAKAVFDIKTGIQLEIHDIVKDTSGLKKELEKEFRKEREIPSEKSLTEAGFWFEKDVFTFPVNFGITENGMEFYYNSYEVAPYADGPTEVLIDKSVLKKFRD